MNESRVDAPFSSAVRGFSALGVTGSPRPPRWLKQVHGARVVYLGDWREGIEADAAWTDVPGQVAAVRTADCVPILLAAPDGACAAAIHAGWRGLAEGVVAAAVAALPISASALRAWIGPCIRQSRYEVGRDVRHALSDFGDAFLPARSGHWMADLPGIAARQLAGTGVTSVDDCGLCTAADPRLPSHRRAGSTNRLVTLIWIRGGAGRPESAA
jgi:YfiH family protein